MRHSQSIKSEIRNFKGKNNVIYEKCNNEYEICN